MTQVLIGITVNGKEHLLTEEMTVRELLDYLKLPDKGIALAVDRAVFPNSRWSEQVRKGWEIEVLTAVQGG
jgi:sulfur carrier protein